MATQKPTRRRTRKRHSAARRSRAPTREQAAAVAPAGAERSLGTRSRPPAGERSRLAGAARSRPARGTGRSAATTYGERPPGPFGGLPVSELAILGGLVAVVVGWVRGTSAALIAGFALCFLGVLELTAREHFSGYRSHALLLAGMVAVALESVLGLLIVPGAGALLLLAVVPVFAACFALLRRRFSAARQARVRAYPPA